MNCGCLSVVMVLSLVLPGIRPGADQVPFASSPEAGEQGVVAGYVLPVGEMKAAIGILQRVNVARLDLSVTGIIRPPFSSWRVSRLPNASGDPDYPPGNVRAGYPPRAVAGSKTGAACSCIL